MNGSLNVFSPSAQLSSSHAPPATRARSLTNAFCRTDQSDSLRNCSTIVTRTAFTAPSSADAPPKLVDVPSLPSEAAPQLPARRAHDPLPCRTTAVGGDGGCELPRLGALEPEGALPTKEDENRRPDVELLHIADECVAAMPVRVFKRERCCLPHRGLAVLEQPGGKRHERLEWKPARALFMGGKRAREDEQSGLPDAPVARACRRRPPGRSRAPSRPPLRLQAARAAGSRGLRGRVRRRRLAGRPVCRVARATPAPPSGWRPRAQGRERQRVTQRRPRGRRGGPR
eukprot:scaffold291993_cov24-Tisochrysis_lutea.AAC.1